ncbi:hypothetical protein B0H15DRAFT_556214 [Mycena belliarum]|uniref:Transmembrane protein n=1 Tax=Mycena belliarum TaxID=1033014 RepID=A0AAD6XP12_9AGAR|nr:hypothetical protein B0H15DRAFT_556214 [Mycena belliae]
MATQQDAPSGSRTPTPPNAGRSHPSSERTVTDPVTHLSLPVHDSTFDELQQISRPSTPQSGDGQPNLDAFRKSHMNGVIDAEARKDWVDDGTRSTKIQTAGIAALAAFAGASVVLLFSRVLGTTMGGWAASFFVGAMCCILGLVAAASVMYFWNPQSPQVQLHGEETQLHKV